MIKLMGRLIAAIEQRFPERPWHCGMPPDEVLVFPAAHPNVGNVCLVDVGAEGVLVYLGKFTHKHFFSDDKSLGEEEAADRVVAMAMAFLEDVFADRIVMYGSYLSDGGTFEVGSMPEGIDATIGPFFVW